MPLPQIYISFKIAYCEVKNCHTNSTGGQVFRDLFQNAGPTHPDQKVGGSRIWSPTYIYKFIFYPPTIWEGDFIGYHNLLLSIPFDKARYRGHTNLILYLRLHSLYTGARIIFRKSKVY